MKSLTREATYVMDTVSEKTRDEIFRRADQIATDDGAKYIDGSHAMQARIEVDTREPHYCDDGQIYPASGPVLADKVVSIVVRKLGISKELADYLVGGLDEVRREQLWFETEFDDWREASINNELVEQSRIKCLYCGKPLILKNGHCQTCGAALEDYT